MVRWSDIGRIRRPKRKTQDVILQGWQHGLNTSVPAFQIQQSELAEALNFKINTGGQLETRPPITAYSTTATTSNAAIKAIQQVNIGGTNYTLLVDANYKLYYLIGTVPTLIGTLGSADVQIIPYNGVAVICDGSYLKYTDISNLKLCYDGGTGTTGFQFDNSSGVADSTLALGNGTNTRISYKFTSQTWASGWTIPPTDYTVKLSRTGNGFTGTDNVAITARLRLVSDDSILAAKTVSATATAISTSATEYSITFTSADITTEMSPTAIYYMSIEYTNGDASHYINVHCSDVTSGGLAFVYAGSWAADTGANPIMSLQPGMPPKASFAAVHNRRLFLSGDSDNPGYVWFSFYTHLDWSMMTSGSDGGGYIGVIDSSNTTYSVGGIISQYDDLWIYGKEDQPYIAKLFGWDPSDFEIKAVYQKGWTTHRVLLSTGNDIWSTSKEGVDPITGVQEYGDIRTFSASDPISDRLDDYWATGTAIAGYYPKDGQYWLYMPTYSRVLVAHTKRPVVDFDGSRSRYPWTEYELTKSILTASTFKWTASANGTNEYYCDLLAGGDPSILTPDFIQVDGKNMTEGTVGSLEDHEWDYGDNDTLGYSTVYFRDESGDPDSTSIEIRNILAPQCFANFGGDFYIGGSDGFIYKIDTSDYKDQSDYHIRYDIRTSYINSMYTHINLVEQQLNIYGTAGGQLNLNFYTDDRFFTPIVSYTYQLSLDDSLTVSELTMDVGDAYFTINPAYTPMFQHMNLNARTFQVQIKDIYRSGYPVYINSLMFRYRILEA